MGGTQTPLLDWRRTSWPLMNMLYTLIKTTMLIIHLQPAIFSCIFKEESVEKMYVVHETLVEDTYSLWNRRTSLVSSWAYPAMVLEVHNAQPRVEQNFLQSGIVKKKCGARKGHICLQVTYLVWLRQCNNCTWVLKLSFTVQDGIVRQKLASLLANRTDVHFVDSVASSDALAEVPYCDNIFWIPICAIPRFFLRVPILFTLCN